MDLNGDPATLVGSETTGRPGRTEPATCTRAHQSLCVSSHPAKPRRPTVPRETNCLSPKQEAPPVPEGNARLAPGTASHRGRRTPSPISEGHNGPPGDSRREGRQPPRQQPASPPADCWPVCGSRRFHVNQPAPETTHPSPPAESTRHLFHVKPSAVPQRTGIGPELQDPNPCPRKHPQEPSETPPQPKPKSHMMTRPATPLRRQESLLEPPSPSPPERRSAARSRPHLAYEAAVDRRAGPAAEGDSGRAWSAPRASLVSHETVHSFPALRAAR